jgi:hypothetical protein
MVGRFHGLNLIPTNIGWSGCYCSIGINEVSVTTAHMIVFTESIAQDQSISRKDSSLPSCETD